MEMINMRDEILDFAKEMDKTMNRHQVSKGDSWKTCEISFLKNKLGEEYEEFIETVRPSELIDIANICMMLHHRINNF